MNKEKMPVLFVGHGSPMNAIEDNEFSRGWKEIAKKIPTPKAILVVSAHYYTNGTKTDDTKIPKLIYDMYGFPDELYNVQYPVSGAPKTVEKTISLLKNKATIDKTWGIDHGAWSVLVHMYPNADIPVFELSIDRNLPLEEHYEIGRTLSSLREDGVLILCSGNIVHNLQLIDWQIDGGFDWAYSFDQYIKENVLNRNIENIIHYQNAGDSSNYAFFTKEHYIPLLYALGASDSSDSVTVFNEKCVLGSLSMTSYYFE